MPSPQRRGLPYPRRRLLSPSGGTREFTCKLPDFEYKQNEDFELFNVPARGVLEEVLLAEAERLCVQPNKPGRVVYEQEGPSPYQQKLNGGAKTDPPLPYYIPESPDDTTLIFESRFESGNLAKAIQMGPFEYNLVVNPDYFTNKHTQWFFFSVANTRRGIPYKFNIVNLMKADSLYNQGQKPLFYSLKRFELEGKTFYRDGNKICYFVNNLRKKTGGYFNTLTFTLVFPYDNDCVYMSHAYPYTYTKLNTFLDDIMGDEYRKRFIRRKELCLTMAGNRCELLIITNHEETVQMRNKRAVVFNARVHPGENMASFAMESVIYNLCGPSLTSKLLRDNFIFYIVPMLNIDGVVVGNHRCNLSGVDLNRQWHDPSKKNHPTIFHTKALMKKIKEERELFVYCDIHGHNRKKNIFFYGCPVLDGSKKEMVFPIIMNKNCDVFSLKDCSWAIPKDRENCARVIVWKELGLVNSFTLEISYLGAGAGKYECYHFNTQLFNLMGESLLKTILDAADSGSDNFRDAILEIESSWPKKTDPVPTDKNPDDSY